MAGKSKYRIDDNGRVCSKCKKYRTWDWFTKGSGARGRTSQCKKCTAKESKQWRDNNKDKINFSEWRNKNLDYDKERKKKWAQGPAKYDTYAHKLFIEIENPIKDARGYLLVRCTKCGKYFTPTVSAVRSRINGIYNSPNKECNLYCSEECKKNCSIFNRSKYTSDMVPSYNNREYAVFFHNLILAEDNYECQLCGAKDIPLVAHHIISYKTSPIESLDVLNGITLCKDCHDKIHSRDGCKYGELAYLDCEYYEKYKEQFTNWKENILEYSDKYYFNNHEENN